jgi:hypothetical protein
MTLRQVTLDAITIVTLVAWGRFVVSTSGGRRAFRHRRVQAAIVAGAAGALLLVAGARHHLNRDLRFDLYMLAVVAFLGGLGVAWGIASRRAARIAGIVLQDPSFSVDKFQSQQAAAFYMFADDPLSEIEADDLSARLSRAELEELLRLIEPIGGAPGFSWLTPAWVRNELSARSLKRNEGAID